MTKIVTSTDWHADAATLGVRRYDEVAAAVDESVDVAIDERADCYICLGDISDPDSGGDTFRAQFVMIRAAMKLANAGVRSIWLAGNHDVCEDGTGATTLTPLLALESTQLVHVAEQPRLVWLDPGLAVLCLPFMAVSHGHDIAAAASALWPSELNSGMPRVIVASHLTVPGVVAGEETTEMPRGRDVVYPFEQTKRAVLRLQGHYHHRQTFDARDGGPPLVIPGSLARLSFSDEHEPSYLVINL